MPVTIENDVPDMEWDEYKQLQNVSDELVFKRGKLYTRVYHQDTLVAILACPGRYVLLQNQDGTLEARKYDAKGRH